MYLDCGNTRLKWRQDGQSGSVSYDNLDQWASSPPFTLDDASSGMSSGVVRRVVFAAVRYDESLARAVTSWKSAGIEVFRIESSARAAGVTCAYEDPSKLGVDRWLAVIAAWHQRTGNVVIVDAGTAITVDSVSVAGRHLGGYIVPGLGLMLRSLAAETERVKVELSEFEASLAPAVETDGAVNRGATLMVVGLVVQAVTQMLESVGPADVATIFVCGGDGPRILPHIERVAGSFKSSVEVQLEPDLVLDGLEIVQRSA